MAQESEIPLLAPESPTDRISEHSDIDVYKRFSNRRKNAIVALVSWCGLLPLFVSGSFIPLAVSISFVGTSVGGLIGASYSNGRRPMYLIGLPLLCIGSVALGLSRTLPELMIFRFLQALGAAPGLSVGAGVIGDIFVLEERGTAMGIFFGACLLGPALSPLAGGLAAHYSTIGFLCIVLFFPETSHPGTRGVDKLIRETNGAKRYAFVNPLKCLWLLRSPNLLAVGAHYNITNEALLGACFLPAGIGNIVGAPLAGRLSDQILIKWKKRRGGRWRLLFVPLSVLLSGFTLMYLEGPLGIAVTLCCLFFNGLGVDMVLNPIGTYSVDIFLTRSAEGIAGNKGLRSILVSLGIAGIIPSINHLGIVVTHTLAAVLAWIGFGILCLTIRYGQEMRDSFDMGYTDTQ
ncbi:major facilitator superfamily domain-containing protein [Mycena rebaudengoi]|nr:major facilitator superfamily domain-containing protein [Mycena rebaudengoi]